MPATLSQPASIQQLHEHFARIHGRDRLDAELLRIAMDLIGPYDRDDLPAAEREWLEQKVSVAVNAALEPALQTFLAELAAGLVEAPDDLLARVTRAKLRRELGGE